MPRGLTFEVRKRYSNDEGQRMLVLEIVRDDVDKMRTKNRGTTITKREAKRTAPKPDMTARTSSRGGTETSRSLRLRRKPAEPGLKLQIHSRYIGN